MICTGWMYALLVSGQVRLAQDVGCGVASGHFQGVLHFQLLFRQLVMMIEVIRLSIFFGIDVEFRPSFSFIRIRAGFNNLSNSSSDLLHHIHDLLNLAE